MRTFSMLFILTLLRLEVNEALNILIFPIHLPSRENFYEFLQTHLRYADHNATFLIYKTDTKSLTIQPPPQSLIIEDDPKESPRDELELWEKTSLSSIGIWREEKHATVPNSFRKKLATRCTKVLEDKNLIRTLRLMKLQLILTDLHGNDICGMKLGEKLKVVVAGFLSHRLTEPFAYKIFAPFNSAYLSIKGNSLDTLSSRLSNFYQYWKTLSLWESTYFDVASNAVCVNEKKCTAAAELYRDLSIVFINSDLTLEASSRPLPPNTVFLAGLHCQVSALLPKDLDNIARSYRAGLIYVSLVTALDGASFPKPIIDIIMSGLGGLPYVTFWKTNYVAPNDTVLPKNILIENRLSTQDVLGHGRTRLAVTVCDMSTVISCIYHGVPLICIPLSEDHLYIARTLVVPKEIGLMLTLDKLTSQSLLKAVQNIVGNKSYRLNAKVQGELLRDKPETPSDRLAFWLEYVVRRNGTENLRVSAVGMNLFTYLFFDFLLLIVLCIFLVISAIIIAFKFRYYYKNLSKLKIMKSD